MKLSIALSALLTAGFRVGEQRSRPAPWSTANTLAYPAGCIVRPGVRVLRPPAESREPCVTAARPLGEARTRERR